MILSDTGEGGTNEATRDATQPDVGVQGAIPLVFYTAKAEDGRAWIGGFLEISRDVGSR